MLQSTAPVWSGRSPEEILAVGIDHHRAGRFEAAEAAYRRVVAVRPEDADTLHLLGLLAYQQQRHAQAIDHIGKAIGLQGGRAHYHNNAALAYLALGRLAEAEASCRNAIRLDSAYPTARSTLGTVLRLGGRPLEAEDSCRAAIGLDPGFAGAHCQLGYALCDLRRLDEAAEAFRSAIGAAPALLEAYLGLGAVLRALGRPGEAEPCYRRALTLDPANAELHNALGVTLRSLERPDEAESCYRTALRLDPGFAQPHNNLGTLSSARGRHGEAAASYRAALRLKPDYAEAHSNLGGALLELGCRAEAEECQRTALRLDPDLAEAHYNLGNVLLAQSRPAAAEQSYRQALALEPDYADAHFNLGTLQLEQRRLADAEASYLEALRHQPDHEPTHCNLGQLYLLTGKLETGWRHYEWRIALHGAGRRNFAAPRWAGEPIGERILLVHAEQGLGDTLQFCRYVPILARTAQLVFEVQAPLLRLLSDLPGIVRIVAAGDELPPFDVHCPLLSVPHLVGTNLASIPGEVPYLAVDPVRSSFWHRRLAGLDGLRVGLVWAGGSRPEQPAAAAIDRRRSMALDRMAPLGGIEGVNFISLQKGPPAVEAETPPSGLILHDFTGELTDFAETAALIDALDLVVSVDTAVAHLAGALGKPVWLLNRFDSCWRWLENRTDSPWYPTLRQFRQPAAGDWPSVVSEVAAALSMRVREPPAAARPRVSPSR